MGSDEKDYQKTALFTGMTEEEISQALQLSGNREKTYKKGQVVLHAGDMAPGIGLMLEGSVTIESNDMWGNRTILGNVGKGQVFAETYALLPDVPLLVDVAANENCRILFLRTGSILHLTDLEGLWAHKLMANILAVSVRKNLHLSGRSFHTSPKSVRGRVMAYLNTVSLQKRSRQFDIPFDRQQLADYLNLDRSALSKELGKMQKDGLIRAKKNHFEII